MNKKDILQESLRISCGLIISFVVILLISEFDLIPIEREYSFFLEWVGLVAIAAFFISYLVAFISLKREEVKQVNYRDSKIYLYSIIFIVGIYGILIIYFG